MFATDDTIVAIATPAGRGALGVIRIMVLPRTRFFRAITTRQTAFPPRHAALTRIRDAAGPPSPAGVGAPRAAGAVDHVIATYFPAPHSTPARTLPKSARTAVQWCCARSFRRRWAPARGWRGLANSRCARFSRVALISCRRRLSQIRSRRRRRCRRAGFDQLEGTPTRRIAALDAELFDPDRAASKRRSTFPKRISLRRG